MWEGKKRLEALKMWIWRKMEKTSWMEKVNKEEVLRRVGEKRAAGDSKKEKTRGHW